VSGYDSPSMIRAQNDYDHQLPPDPRPCRCEDVCDCDELSELGDCRCEAGCVCE
jgi:hypothetical protein